MAILPPEEVKAKLPLYRIQSQDRRGDGVEGEAQSTL